MFKSDFIQSIREAVLRRPRKCWKCGEPLSPDVSDECPNCGASVKATVEEGMEPQGKRDRPLPNEPTSMSRRGPYKLKLGKKAKGSGRFRRRGPFKRG